MVHDKYLHKGYGLNDLINLPGLSEIKNMWIKNYPEYDRNRRFASYDEVERFDSTNMVQVPRVFLIFIIRGGSSAMKSIQKKISKSVR